MYNKTWISDVFPKTANHFQDGLNWLESRSFHGMGTGIDGSLLSMRLYSADNKHEVFFSVLHRFKVGKTGWTVNVIVSDNAKSGKSKDKKHLFSKESGIHEKVEDAFIEIRETIDKAFAHIGRDTAPNLILTDGAWLDRMFPQNETWFADGRRFMYEQGFFHAHLNMRGGFSATDGTHMCIDTYAEMNWMNGKTDERGWKLDAYYCLPDRETPLIRAENQHYHRDIRDAFRELNQFFKKGFMVVRRHDELGEIRKVGGENWIDRIIPKQVWKVVKGQGIPVPRKSWFVEGMDWMNTHGFIRDEESLSDNGTKFIYMPRLKNPVDGDKFFWIVVEPTLVLDDYEYKKGKALGWQVSVEWGVYGEEKMYESKSGYMDVREALFSMKDRIEQGLDYYRKNVVDEEAKEAKAPEEEPEKPTQEMTIEEKNAHVEGILKNLLARDEKEKAKDKKKDDLIEEAERKGE